MKTKETPKKKILKERGYFLLEVIIVFVGIMLFSLLFRTLVVWFIAEDNVLYGPLFFLLRALAILIAIPICLYISEVLLESQKKDIILEEDVSPAMSHLKLYGATKGNFKFQLLFGILLLFLVFIPLDFLIYYLFPDTIRYSAEAFRNNPANNYLLQSYTIFIVSVIIIQISVAIYEESLTRGFEAKRGADQFNRMSAVMIASIHFGFMHFAIIEGIPLWFPMFWVMQAFIVGIILSLVLVNKKWIFPVIFAHALNNIISAHALWNYNQGNEFSDLIFILYVPLLIVSVFLLVWQFPRIKEGLSMGVDEFKAYFANDDKIGKEKGDKVFRIIIDILFGLIIFVIGIFLV